MPAATTTMGGGSDDNRAARKVAAVVSKSPTPTPTPSALLAATVPRGVYTFTRIVVDPDPRLDFGEPGFKETRKWTFGEPTCDNTACTGTIKSSSGRTFAYTWDGKQLGLPPEAPLRLEGGCVSDVTQERLPGSHLTVTVTVTTEPMSPPPAGAALQGPPTELTAFYNIDFTYSDVVPPDCRGVHPGSIRHERTIVKDE